MDEVVNLFQKGKSEIELYFNFIGAVDYDSSSVLRGDGSDVELIDPALKVVLFANTFLLLYNLIEATVRNSLVSVYTKIGDENVAFDDLSDSLKNAWVELAKKKLIDLNSDSIRKFVFEYSDGDVCSEICGYAKYNMPFSGNLDAREIRNISKRIGFSEVSNGRNLNLIKNKRNRLAHGEQTFYGVGKDYSLQDLKKFKNETFSFLQEFVDNVKQFIDEQQYCVAGLVPA